ncbi:MAG: ABC transporter permease [Vicinamibacterales bacterium]
MTPRRSIGARLHRLLLGLLPGEFRGDFGDAMAADVEAAGARGAAFWWREIGSLLKTAAREHLDALRQDVKYALRMMRRTPGFAALAVLMLALGTGVNVAMFSIVDAVMLRSPFENPSELVAVRMVVNDRATWAVPRDRYRDLVGAPGPLVAVGAFTVGSHVLTGQGDPINVDDIECFSSGMFEVLRTRPLLGRTFGPADDNPGAEPTIVLSHDFWRQLGGSPAILGTALTINQTPVTVVGVMPKGFAGPLARADVQGWMPLGRQVKSAENAGCSSGTVNVVGRLQRGLSLDTVKSALPGFVLTPLESPIMEDVRTPFNVLMIAVACVLLIACFNVGGLQMERSLARRREMALRLALGASRGRLVRQTLTENLLLALAGAAAGIVATSLTLRSIVSMLPSNVPYLDQIELNVRVLAVTMGAATAAGLIAGLLPIAQMRQFTPARDLTDATRASERRGSWGRRVLVVVEIAMSIVVLIGAALMVQTFLTLRPTRPGFDPADKLVMPVRLRGAAAEASEQFFAQVFERLKSAPAIRDAAGTTHFPMSGNITMAALELDETMRDIWTTYTTPGFFTLMKMPLVAGRMFSAGDTRASTPVIIVNEMLARRIRADGHVLGERILVKSQGGPAAAVAVERTIVGVIANTRSSGVDTRARMEAYVPYAQNPVAGLQIVAEAKPGRQAEAASEMRAVVRALRPDLVVAPSRSMEDMIRQRMGATPFGAWLLGVIAALAVGLAAIGLMATIGWWVRQRTRELGVRIALGATRGGVTALVFRQGMTLAVSGVALGCAAAMGLTRYLAGWIYGVTPLDAATFVGCAVLMLLVAAVAVYFPVRRATSVDPVVALRSE